MNIFRVHRLPLFQAPDAPVEPTPVVDPALAAQDPPVVDPQAPPAAAIDPVIDSAAPPAADAPVEPKPHGNKGKKPWYLDRISEETAARQAAEQVARDATELAQRLQRTPPNAADPARPPAADEPAIEARARQIADERIAGSNIQSVISAGVGEFADWDERAATLGAAGAASPAFVLNVHAVDPLNAHKILHALSDDPAKAARLARMDSRSQTVELVKMSLAAQGAAAAPTNEVKPAVPPRTVSRAPAPPPPLEPGSTQVVDWRTDNKISDSEWSKRWDEDQRQKAASRRR